MESHESIREKLIARRGELIERLAKITDDVRHTDGPVSADFAEQAVERENEEVLDAIGEAGRTELAAINEAVARIDSGDYGVCARCGEDIPAGRLDALPFSTLCVGCADRAGA